MKRICTSAAAALVLLSVVAPPAAAQNREHQQMAADLRMLQEQQQQLALTLAQLGDALKAITTRIDQSNETARKGFADQKLVIDAINTALGVLRERSDDTNVRLGTLREEVSALRASIPTLLTPPAAPPGPDGVDPNAAPGASAQAPAAPAPPTPSTVGLSPTRMYETAFADYAAGQWTLALTGFQEFLRTFPQFEMADDAQFYIGETYYAQRQFAEAIAAYNAVIQNYPMGDQVPLAYYKRGLSQQQLGQTDAARMSWETAVMQFPDTDGGRLAKAGLDRLERQPQAAPPPPRQE